MNSESDSPYVDASLRAVDKKRSTRDGALAELSQMIQYNEETNPSLNIVVDRISEAIMKGVDMNLAALALSRVVISVPESNAFGPVAEKLIKYVRDPSKSWDARAPLAVALGTFALFTGHFSDIYFALPTQITDTLFVLLEEAITTHATWPVVQQLLTATNLACLGLESGFLAGWVYNKYIPLLLLTVVYYPDSYAPSQTASPVFHGLSLLILAKQASEVEAVDVVFRTDDTSIYGKTAPAAAVGKGKGPSKAPVPAPAAADAAYGPLDEVEDDDEYYYDADVHVPIVRLSIEGITRKLAALAAQEIEVVDGEVNLTALQQLLVCVKEVVQQEPVPELNPLCQRPKDAPKGDSELFIRDWESRCLYFSLVEALKTTLPRENTTGQCIFSGEVEKNPFLQNLLCVDEAATEDNRRKDLAFLLARKEQRKRHGVVVSDSRRQKHEACYGAQE